MDALFSLENGGSAEEIRERLSDPPSYSAVRAMLARLEAKGFVKHREDGPRYIYSATRSRASVQRSALDKLVQVFFGGSPRQTALALLKQESWTDDELDSLRAEIERVREKAKTGRRS
jgi:predicted transcriptional regulator